MSDSSGLSGAHDRVFLYDTTLRDGAQQWGITLTLDEKLKVAKLLDAFGIPYIEGGWPGANPKDSEFFRRAGELGLMQAKIAAFGSTRRAGITVDKDRNIAALLAAETPVVTLVGKSWQLHVEQVLRTSESENLLMIEESVAFMKKHGREVIYDAEHFFDGFRADAEYALRTLQAAVNGGADWIILCDTNGGSLPSWVEEVVRSVRSELGVKLGIHTHNDSDFAVANSVAAVTAGCRQVQGTINGYGERCGNANLISLIPALQIKLNYDVIPPKSLTKLTGLSRQVSEIVNINQNPHAPYVGASAFAHKGGIHVAAVEKVSASYEHVPPECVGNYRDVVISELSGRGNVRALADELELDVQGKEGEVLREIKELELRGYQFENAEGSFELFIRRKAEGYAPPFVVEDLMVVSEQNQGVERLVQAAVKLSVEGEMMHTAAEGDGPVHALDRALRKALIAHFPHLEKVHLADYKVRILDPDKATDAVTRVLIEAGSNGDRWSTVGVSKNIIDASFQALADSYELYILRTQA
ncbi:MAG TPA: citramalate synthase [Oligoflexia bacterium]|nr:citramalate synthase [Oligoflexia bacterium]